jgi:hypothetical protein
MLATSQPRAASRAIRDLLGLPRIEDKAHENTAVAMLVVWVVASERFLEKFLKPRRC